MNFTSSTTHFLSSTSTFALSKFSISFRFNFINIFFCALFLVSLAKLYLITRSEGTRKRNIFLVDFSCYKPDDVLKCSYKIFIDRSSLLNVFSDESIEFQKTILEKSGLGQSTYFPRAMWGLPPNPCMAEGRNELETVIFGAIDDLLAKTGIKATEIGILVTNSSLFNPAPSICSMIINRYKMSGSVLCYNLGGMGCSAGVISADLAKHLLQVHPNTYALVVSTENITLNWYWGNKRSMLVPNCLFRMGASAILLSNRPCDKNHSKYQLLHTIRTHKANEDRGYKCAFQEEDDDGKVGVTLSKDLASVAGDALRINLTTLAPLVLPISEQLYFFANLLGRKVLKMDIKPYTPDFKKAFDHFCVHAGGKGVLNKVEKSLDLSEKHIEASRMTLFRF
ncbi:3-ketoacyl-CoA synthase, partial [Thalictrum thalictroides]